MTDKDRADCTNRNPETTHARFEWDDTQPPSMAICQGVAAVLGVEPTDLTPLGESVDPEALDQVVNPAVGPGNGPVSVDFRYEGVDVFVDSGRIVELEVPCESVDGKNPP